MWCVRLAEGPVGFLGTGYLKVVVATTLSPVVSAAVMASLAWEESVDQTICADEQRSGDQCLQCVRWSRQACWSSHQATLDNCKTSGDAEQAAVFLAFGGVVAEQEPLLRSLWHGLTGPQKTSCVRYNDGAFEAPQAIRSRPSPAPHA